MPCLCEVHIVNQISLKTYPLRMLKIKQRYFTTEIIFNFLVLYLQFFKTVLDLKLSFNNALSSILLH